MSTQTLTLHSLLNELRQAGISYELDQARDEAIMVKAAVPGERWEIEFFEDGNVEVELFRSDGDIRDAAALDELIERHRD